MNHGETKEVKSVNHLPFVSTKRCVFLGGFVVPINLETQSTSSPESMQHTVGRNPPPVDTVNYPIIYKVLYIPGGAGSLPSTVWLFHKRFLDFPTQNTVQNCWHWGSC